VSEQIHSKDNTVFQRLGPWQLWGRPCRQITLLNQGEPRSVEIEKLGENRWQVGADVIELQNRQLQNMQGLDKPTTIKINDTTESIIVYQTDDRLYCRIGDTECEFSRPLAHIADSTAESTGNIIAPMPGRIVSVECQVGDAVSEGQVLVSVEAMKMEHSLRASTHSEVGQILVEVGDQVEQGELLVSFKSKPSE